MTVCVWWPVGGKTVACFDLSRDNASDVTAQHALSRDFSPRLLLVNPLVPCYVYSHLFNLHACSSFPLCCSPVSLCFLGRLNTWFSQFSEGARGGLFYWLSRDKLSTIGRWDVGRETYMRYVSRLTLLLLLFLTCVVTTSCDGISALVASSRITTTTTTTTTTTRTTTATATTAPESVTSTTT